MRTVQSIKQESGVQFLLVAVQRLALPVTISLWLFAGEAPGFVYWISVFVVLQFIWSLWSWRVITGAWFDPYTIFLIAAFLFNAGKAFLEVFHLNKYGIQSLLSNDGHLIFSFSTGTIASALLLVSLGLGAVHLGALWAAARMRKHRMHESLPIVKSAQSSRLVGWFLLIISFVPTVLTIVERFRIVMHSGYFGLFQRQPVTDFENLHQVLAFFIVPGIFFLLAGSKGKPRLLVPCTLLMSVYVLRQAFAGTRLWWAMPLVAYVWLWHCQIDPIPKAFLWLGGASFVFVLFPTIMAVCNLPGSERLTLDAHIRGLFSIESPAIATLQEMGGTLLTVAHTLELIPAARGFDLGLGYLYAMLTVFPNLFWEIHPTVARGLFSNWLVATVAPAAYYAGGGYGFSFIAEAYANFGWIGTPAVLGLVGFLFAKLALWGKTSNAPERAATIASFLAFFLIYARGESALVIRPLIWYAFLPYVMVKLLQRGLR